MQFETDRIILRKWCLDDAKDLYKVAKEKEIGLACGWQPHRDIEESQNVIKNIFLVDKYTFAICLKENNIAIGCISIIPYTKSSLGLKNPNEAELGCWLGKEFWGRGLMVEAMNTLIKFSFEKLKIEKLYSSYFKNNKKSKRLQEKCGFKYFYTENSKLCANLNIIRKLHINILSKEKWRKNGNYKK